MLTVNRDKAQVIAQDKIRRWREKQFAENDVMIQNALADGDATALQSAKDRRDWLRDLPQMCEGKTVDELKIIISSMEQ